MARFDSGNLETLKRLVERGNGMTLLHAPVQVVRDVATATLASVPNSPRRSRFHRAPVHP